MSIKNKDRYTEGYAESYTRSPSSNVSISGSITAKTEGDVCYPAISGSVYDGSSVYRNIKYIPFNNYVAPLREAVPISFGEGKPYNPVDNPAPQEKDMSKPDPKKYGRSITQIWTDMDIAKKTNPCVEEELPNDEPMIDGKKNLLMKAKEFYIKEKLAKYGKVENASNLADQDKSLVINLLQALGFNKSEDCYPGSREYYEDGDSIITIGPETSSIEFNFDEVGKFLNIYVGE